MIKLLLAVVFLLGCTKKNDSTESSESPKSCNQHQTAETCQTAPNCVPKSGIDVTTKENVFLGCLNAFSEALRCHAPVSCFTHSSGQRVVSEESCLFENWTEVGCTESEKKIPFFNPCDVSTASECSSDQKCYLRSARNVVTREMVVIGCVREGGLCGDAITCYTNPDRTIRVIDTQVCSTFPDWESTACEPGDHDALQAQ
ncbi:hypothetical protein [Oligoflexus tunisiensis]|uniref:hypothetical protein n=1 Tax=Oligoflexus tunisiensis TaxID=708132 RepID=UPI001C4050B0|nr:hypothetical protein [Oligoflexus tunisiensis]